jgi:flagellin
MVINTNMSALTSARLLQNSSSLLSKSLQRLSSGSKITSPGDDGAGLAVSIRFDAQVNRITAAQANIQNANSFSQTQDGFLSNVGAALNRMSELTVLSQDTTKTDSDRTLYQQEFTSLSSYINDLATKDYNGVSLFSGATLDVTTDSEGNKFHMTGIQLNTTTYTNALNANIGTLAGATSALNIVKAAITQLSADRALVGTHESRLQSTNSQLGVLDNNITAADSMIKDVDVAQESTQYAQYNILVQSGTAMLAQANQMPQSVLKLIG